MARFLAAFEIDDLMYNFACSVQPSVVPFVVGIAKLEYEKLEQLTATRGFSGKIGRREVVLELDNGPKITGVLEKLQVPASSVIGMGQWTQN